MINGVDAGIHPDLSWPLERAATTFGDSIAVQAAGRAHTYRELARRVGALGDALDELEVTPGGRVGFLGDNSIAHLECWLGIPAAGRVICDLNLRLAPDELAFMIEDAAVQVLVVDAANLDLAVALQARCPTLETLVLDGDDAAAAGSRALPYEQLVAGEPAAAHPAQPTDLAAISYTGGTTGTPKGVMLSHGNLSANAMHNLWMTGHRSQDTFLHVCPMFHAAGIANVFAATWVGARQLILPRFDAAAVAQTIERERVTLTTLVPTMLSMFLDHLDAHPADLSSLRNIHYAGSPISPELQRRVLDRLDCEVAQGYGMTEAAPTVCLLSAEVHRRGAQGHEPDRTRLASVGVAVPGVRAEVRDHEGRRLAPGQVGEIWIAGPNVMLGYWNRPEATQEALVDGWYRSGDAAYSDDDGYLFMVDRLKDMIISGGENVYCIEVENVLVEHEAVSEAAVFGVPDPRWGERVHAVVVPAPGASIDVERLREHCRGRIAGFKVPRSFEVRAEPLPKSGPGKVLKTALREPHWAGSSRRIG